jgi:hypothetical protein
MIHIVAYPNHGTTTPILVQAYVHTETNSIDPVEHAGFIYMNVNDDVPVHYRYTIEDIKDGTWKFTSPEGVSNIVTPVYVSAPTETKVNREITIVQVEPNQIVGA